MKMNIKAAVKYRLWDTKRPLLIFYSIIYTIMAASIIAVTNLGDHVLSFSGFEFASMIFIFVLELNSFKEPFLMFLQNGLSRKTLFQSFVISIVPVSGLLAVIDSLNGLVMNEFMNYESIFLQFYNIRYSSCLGNVGLAQFFEGMLWYLTAYAMLAMVGLFITTLNYRMNRKQRLLFFIGVPVLFVYVIPLVDRTITNGAIYRGIGEFFAFAWGYTNGYIPYYSMVTCALFFVLFGGLTYLLTRKAVANTNNN